jgi:hypothetical protein
MTLENTTIPDCGCLDTDARRCFELRYPNRTKDEYEREAVCGCPCHDTDTDLDECDCQECTDRGVV